jgi:hypothetical protein
MIPVAHSEIVGLAYVQCVHSGNLFFISSQQDKNVGEKANWQTPRTPVSTLYVFVLRALVPGRAYVA